MLEVLEPKNLKLKPYYFFFIDYPEISVDVESNKKLSVDFCYHASFRYFHSDKTLEMSFNKYKVKIKLLKDIDFGYYSITLQEVNLSEDCNYIVLRVFEEWYKFKEKCKLKYKNIEIEIIPKE